VLCQGDNQAALDELYDADWDGTEDGRKKLVERYMAKLDAMEFNDMAS
jgi:hypothetical protein